MIISFSLCFSVSISRSLYLRAYIQGGDPEGDQAIGQPVLFSVAAVQRVSRLQPLLHLGERE